MICVVKALPSGDIEVGITETWSGVDAVAVFILLSVLVFGVSITDRTVAVLTGCTLSLVGIEVDTFAESWGEIDAIAVFIL